jgi:hypothetical protein
MVAEIRRLDRRSAGELVRIDRKARRDEDREAWGRVIHLTGRGHLSVVAERPDVSLHTFSEIRSVATRRLRQLEDSDGAA